MGRRKTKAKSTLTTAPRPDLERFHVRRVEARRILGGIPGRTFATLESDGIIAPTKRGTRGKASIYSLEEIVPAYVAYLSKQRPVMADREARARRDSTLADLNTLRLQRERGELVTRAEIIADGQAFTKGWAAMIRALPRRLRRLGLIDAAREAEIAAVCREILVEISRWTSVPSVEAVLGDPTPA